MPNGTLKPNRLGRFVYTLKELNEMIIDGTVYKVADVEPKR